MIDGLTLYARVGFTAMSGELLHAGHLMALAEAHEDCDYLIVAFNVAPEGKTCAESVFERWARLESCKYVDKLIPYGSERDLLEILAFYGPHIDVRYAGEDHECDSFTGRGWCEAHDIEIVFTPRQHNLSATSLKKRIAEM